MKLTQIEEREYERYFKEFDFSSLFTNKTILITGAKGILGTGVIKWLLRSNQLCGTSTHIIASTRNINSIPHYIEEDDDIEFCEFGKEIVYCEHKKIDFIIHLAAPTSNREFKEKPVESLKAIVDGVQRMLELAQMKSGCKMLYLSSEEAYGTPCLIDAVPETYVGAIDSLNIRSCYPLGKKVSELFCKSYYEEYGVDVRILRPTVILGLIQAYDSVKIEAEILRCILENNNLHMKSAGLTKKSVIYSLDAVSAMFMVLERGQSGEAYNATDEESYCTVKDRAYNMFKKFNPIISIEFENQDSSQALGYLPQRELLEDVSKLKNLGWKTITNVDKIYEIDVERFSENM